jgi:hypothetical protein
MMMMIGDSDMNPDLQTLSWRKSSASGSGNCVEVAMRGGSIFMRDSKDRTGAVLIFNEAEWQAFIVGMQGDEFALEALRT